jgi:hypothetical protein
MCIIGLLASVLRIRINFGKLDPDPHQSGKLDPDPLQSEKQDPDPQHCMARTTEIFIF